MTLNSQDQTFEEWFAQVEDVYSVTLGMGADDAGDATWYDYFADDLSPREAAACAMVDYQDVPFDLIEAVGLGEYV